MFRDLTPDLKAAIIWYKTLPSEKQTALMVDFFKEPSKLSDSDAEKFGLIVRETKLSLALNLVDDVLQRLVEIGIDNALSQVLIEKLCEKGIDFQTSAKALNTLSDKTYEKMVNEVMVNFFLNWQEFTTEQAAKNTNTNASIIQSAIVFLKAILWGTFNGNRNLSAIRQILMDSYNFPFSKATILTQIYEKHIGEIRQAMLFRKFDDVEEAIERLNKSMLEIQTTLNAMQQAPKENVGT